MATATISTWRERVAAVYRSYGTYRTYGTQGTDGANGTDGTNGTYCRQDAGATGGGARGGFTLIEVLVSLGILFGGLIAVTQLFPISLTNARIAAERNVVSQMAQSRLAEVRAMGAETFYARQVVSFGDFARFFANNPQITDPDQFLAENPTPGVLTRVQDLILNQSLESLVASGNLYTGVYSTINHYNRVGNIYHQRITMDVLLPDGRREPFVVHVTRQ